MNNDVNPYGNAVNPYGNNVYQIPILTPVAMQPWQLPQLVNDVSRTQFQGVQTQNYMRQTMNNNFVPMDLPYNKNKSRWITIDVDSLQKKIINTVIITIDEEILQRNFCKSLGVPPPKENIKTVYID